MSIDVDCYVYCYSCGERLDIEEQYFDRDNDLIIKVLPCINCSPSITETKEEN